MKTYFKTQEMEWPKESCFVIVAQGGIYKGRNNMFTRSCVLVSEHGIELEGLLPQEEFCFLRYPKIPRKIMEDAQAFFAETARKHEAEAIVLLGYDINTRQWLPIIPEQKSGGMEVKYEIPDDIEEHVLLPGDIHSHVNSSAFHSGTDIFDEKLRDGIHITLGHVQKKVADISMEIVVDGRRFPLTEEMVLEPWGPRSQRTPEGWMDKFTYKKWEWRGYNGKCTGNFPREDYYGWD